MTRTEKFVYELSNKAFLSLWSFPNPIGKKGKELCDVLIICEPDIIIFSVKEVNIKDSGNPKLDIDRWIKRAIDSSVKQIYGAERFIKKSEEVKLKDGKTTIELPSNVNWNFYRVAVAFGRKEIFPLRFGEFGNGFVHVYDQKSVEIVLSELDTLKDLVNYLKAKEEFILENILPISSGEENILGYYLSNNFSFPTNADVVIFEDDIYDGLSSDKEYQKILEDLKVSYVWDNLIEQLIKDFRDNQLLSNTSRNELELTIRQMAREDRNSRKFLSESFIEFIGMTKEPISKSRIIRSLNNKEIVYVLLLEKHENREQRLKELQLRCFVARSKFDCKTVVGLATEKYNPKGCSFDFCYLFYPDLKEDLRDMAENISEELGYFKNPKIREINKSTMPNNG